MSGSLNLYSKRDLFVLDNLKALSIFLIFLLHSGAVELVEPFFPIMVPLFAFASGFSFKNNDLLSYVKKVSSLYILGNAVYLPFMLYRMIGDGRIDLPILFIGYNTSILWYIASLVLWACGTKVLASCRFPLATGAVLIVLIHHVLCLAEFSGDYAWYWNDYIFHYLRLSVRMFLFFLLGVMMPWEHIVKLRRSCYKYAGLAVSLPLLFLLTRDDYVSVNHGVVGVFLYLCACVICTLTAIALFPGFRIRWVTDVGKASLNVYLLHIAVVYAMMFGFARIGGFGIPIIADIFNYQASPSLVVKLPIILCCCYAFSSRAVSRFISSLTGMIQRWLFQTRSVNR